jgi:hypothetical protein
MPPTVPPFPAVLDTLKRAVAALRDAGLPHLVAGSMAAWARGGPEACHDVDLIVRPADAEAALEALVAAGMRAERPPEGWLLKAWDGDVLVDLIFLPGGRGADDQVEGLFARAEVVHAEGMDLPVLAADDVLVAKLLSFGEHFVDFTDALGMARALREQVDWPAVAERTAGSPYAAAFLALVRGLDVAPAAG